MKNIVVLGIGNYLFSDEGIGVHVVNEIKKWALPENVTVHDAGTLGILSAPLFEGSDMMILIDSVDAEGEPGDVMIYTKDDIMLDRIPLKLSPHQIGIQETLLVSDLRGQCPQEVLFFGAIPASYETSIELTEAGEKAKAEILEKLKEILLPGGGS